jgi:hypothetical protein
MNCKPGDLAVIKWIHPAYSELHGRVVRLSNEPPYSYLGDQTWNFAEAVEFAITMDGIVNGRNLSIGDWGSLGALQDKYLSPIRDPGDDAVDEMVLMLGKPQGVAA